MGYSPWSRKESDTAERLSTYSNLMDHLDPNRTFVRLCSTSLRYGLSPASDLLGHPGLVTLVVSISSLAKRRDQVRWPFNNPVDEEIRDFFFMNL